MSSQLSQWSIFSATDLVHSTARRGTFTSLPPYSTKKDSKLGHGIFLRPAMAKGRRMVWEGFWKGVQTLVNTGTTIKLFYVTEESIDMAIQNMPESIPQVPSTMRIHQILTTSPGQMLYRDVSCMCTVDKIYYCTCYNTGIQLQQTNDHTSNRRDQMGSRCYKKVVCNKIWQWLLSWHHYCHWWGSSASEMHAQRWSKQVILACKRRHDLVPIWGCNLFHSTASACDQPSSWDKKRSLGQIGKIEGWKNVSSYLSLAPIEIMTCMQCVLVLFAFKNTWNPSESQTYVQTNNNSQNTTISSVLRYFMDYNLYSL